VELKKQDQEPVEAMHQLTGSTNFGGRMSAPPELISAAGSTAGAIPDPLPMLVEVSPLAIAAVVS
jgi:hypothetical protein